jgi:quercetin dioxygenase-like cupin family protein
MVTLRHIDKQALAKSDSPIFVGDVFRQGLTEGLSKQLSVAVVSFPNGARNVFHAHAGDQMLIVTEGEGIVASETTEYPIAVGDVAFIPAGERHWHGAQPGKSMTHLAIAATQ